MAIFLGVTIIYTVLKHFRKNMHIDIKLALFLTILDTLSGVDFIFTGILNLPPLNFYANYHGWCVSQVITGSCTFVSSMLVIGVIALERCLLIVYNIRLDDFYYWLMLFICCLVPIILALMTTLTDSVGLMTSGVFCHYDSQTFYGTLAYIIMLVFSSISVGTLVISYTKIVLFRLCHNRKQQLELGLDPIKVNRNTKSTAIKLMSILILNVGTNMPFCLAQLMSLFDPKYLSPKVAFFVVPWCGLNIVWNSLLFLGIQEKVYIKWKETLGFKSMQRLY
jgi:hypothetical protein